MTLDSKVSGVYAIAPTPFQEDGAIDWGSIDRMVEFYFDVGCSGLTVLGVLGEATKLDAAEAQAVAQRVIQRAKGKPVIVGVSASGFAAMRSLARSVMDLGAAGVMIGPPNTLRTADRTGGEEADEECAISCHGVTNHPRVRVGPWGRTRSVTTAARVSAVGATALIGHSRTN